MHRWRFGVLSFIVASAVVPACLLAVAMKEPKPKQKLTHWLVNFDQAAAYARKDDKPILLYFSGSDWDAWTQKLEKDVLNTELFQQWAQKNVILLQVDSTMYKTQSSITKQQGEKLKNRYSVAKVPTFVFADPSGQPFARGGYDDVRLRDEEQIGRPAKAIAYLQGELARRPGNEELVREWSLPQAMALAKKKYRLLLLAVSKGEARTVIKQRDTLFADQQFVRFVNRNLVFYSMDWPESASSPEAQVFLDFAQRHKLNGNEPFQFIIWQPYGDEIKSRISSFDLMHVDQLVTQITAQLPHLDYTSGWITDYSSAKAIAAQQTRYVFLSFESDAGDWSKKMQDEIYNSDEFKTYARKRLVLVKVDFPTATSQPASLVDQNKLLAEMFAIRGYPTVVVINPIGQKVVETKYIKGGAGPFLGQLDAIIARDADRLAALKEK